MFVYADETGNSGRNIFDVNEWYRLGALMTVPDVETSLKDIIGPTCSRLGVERIHAHEMEPDEAAALGAAVVDHLDDAGDWIFFTFSVHKPYLATTKFVDTIFDAGENIAVPHLWYNLELYRHGICLEIDSCMTPLTRKRFWEAFLADNVAEIQACIRNIQTYVPRKVGDPRMREVIKDAFQFALKHPEQFTLLAAEKRASYKGQTPNMVAFTSLFNEIHLFTEKYNSPPIAFIHDQQQEFKKEMKQAYDTFGPIRTDEHPLGAIPEVTRVTYDLAKFTMPSSKDSFALQATDLLLWIFQRSSPGAQIQSLKARLSEKVKEIYISRRMSELTVQARIIQSNNLDLSEGDLARGRHLLEASEDDRRTRVQAFEGQKKARVQGR